MNPVRGTGKKAIVLVSGGLDSATTLYYAKSKGYDCKCLVFDYGQRHRREIESAKEIVRSAGFDYRVIKFNFPWKGSALLDRKIPLPLKNALRKKGRGIPPTYVPARNMVFISFAVSYAEAIGAGAVFIGANAVDFSGYPDCRPGYYEVFNKLIARGTRSGLAKRKIRIFTPLIDMTKAEIIKLGKRLGVPYGSTWSCYAGGRRPCLECDSCIFRAKGFSEAGIKDPLLKI